jgi:uncharacterized protein YifE (UPF0438 family)
MSKELKFLLMRQMIKDKKLLQEFDEKVLEILSGKLSPQAEDKRYYILVEKIREANSIKKD